MKTRYLLRFDDICPTMNWRIWDEIEEELRRRNLSPLLGVVPDNRDTSLDAAPARADFWDRVRGWQRLGWTIGLHGYQHRYVTFGKSLVGLQPFSEFAGLDESEQRRKLEEGLRIFTRERVRADIWIAPAHSFDGATLRVLKALGVGIVSDGYFRRPVTDEEGVIWVPQQIWRLRPMPPGCWTTCYHVNGWTPRDMSEFRHSLDRFGSAILSLDATLAEFPPRPLSSLDKAAAGAFRLGLRARRRLKRRGAESGAPA